MSLVISNPRNSIKIILTKLTLITFTLVSVNYAFMTVMDVFAQEEPWKTELGLQVMKWRFCELVYTTNSKVEMKDKVRIITGRAHCNDGRSFDFEGKGELPEFKFVSCQPVRC